MSTEGLARIRDWERSSGQHLQPRLPPLSPPCWSSAVECTPADTHSACGAWRPPWETASSFSCPQCRATFPVRPQLRRNVALANLGKQIRVGDGMAVAVVCDICGDGHTPAVKTCLRCEMSFCATHLRPHVENPRLRDHAMVDPIANLDGRRCQQHRQEQIKFYCEQDESLVCTVCTIAGGHKGHAFIPVENAQRTKQESLRGTKERISREFERRREQLTAEEREALERVDEEGRSVLSRIQADIARYESRACGLEQEINQLLATLAVQDPISFLQDPLHESLRRSTVSQETQDDPAPISHGLNLAKVISCRSQALCSESFSSGQHYWEVDVGSAKQCLVGAAYGTIPRRGSGAKCLLGLSDVSWCLQKDNDSFSVVHGRVVTSLSVPQPPRRVGVHLDWDAGLLSFYSADSMALLHSFHQTFTQPLHPGLWVAWSGDSVRILDLSDAS
uniref:E3 ubiquitin-protein ligase TRIM39-like n=1 Tax=Petromyzon marinus TaxID=7757 RepID=A0AAJ7UHC4_PETMA|nr:E3 ubiquitin-protein ligase TRIM39-like [Petromyzon marinus]